MSELAPVLRMVAQWIDTGIIDESQAWMMLEGTRGSELVAKPTGERQRRAIPDGYLREEEAAERLSMTAVQLAQLRKNGTGPTHTTIGRVNAYAIPDLEAWRERTT